jgi:hypothetical protein
MKNNEKMAAIAVDKCLLKEYDTKYGRTVYLDNGSEFQIKLFNPYNYTVGAEIFINGKSLRDILVIRPGQIVWLERYLQESRKFKFDVYEVDTDNEAVRKAIKENGQITVKFFKEVESLKYELPWYYERSITDTYDYTASTNVNNWAQPTLTTSNISTLCCLNATSDSSPVYSLRASSLDTKQETGRIEKGGHSSQRLTSTNIDFESYPFATEEIKLLPKSQKPVYKGDLEKMYCPECGRKIKSKFKYCPFCGEKL